jgi:hypothetical protein
MAGPYARALSRSCSVSRPVRLSTVFDSIFAVSPTIRYVAVGRGQDVQLRERPDLADASSSESDRYEELLVNPTLIKLARQRGEIDCGGLDYLVVAYGNFFQLVLPINGGHVSVAIERSQSPTELVEPIRRAIG